MSNDFIHLLFIGLIALFPVVNPLGSAFIIEHYFKGLDREEKRNAVKKVVFYAFSICSVSLFSGRYILELFGLSIPIIQLAGGIMICKMGWELLSKQEQSQDKIKMSEVSNKETSLENKLFYPISFPITTGPGTMSVLFTLSAHSAGIDFNGYIVNTLAIFISILIMCVLIYIFYLNTGSILNFLGKKGEIIINQMSSFLIFCVGLQIAFSGIKTLLKM